MQRSIYALRALGAVVLRDILRPILYVLIAFFSVAYLLTLVLSSLVSLWWLLTLIVLVPASFLSGVLFLLLWQATSRLIPRSLSRKEQRKVREFCRKIIRIVERAKLPYPVLVMLIGKDILRGRESTFLEEIIGDSRALTREFNEIREML